MDSLILWLAAGCIAGICTGLAPGIHTNTIAVLALAVLPNAGIEMAVFIAAMSIVHAFVDFVPGILVGIPNADTFLAVLPAHRLFHEGRALQAVLFTTTGGLIAGTVSLVLAPLIGLFLMRIAPALTLIIPILLSLILFSILCEPQKRFWNFSVVILSGLLGLLVSETSLPIQQPLFPLITGLFGMSGILHSLAHPTKPVEQRVATEAIPLAELGVASVYSTTSGILVAIFPGLGSGQAAYMVQRVIGDIPLPVYLMMLGGIATANTLVPLIAWSVLGSTRSGTMVAIDRIIPPEPVPLLMLSMTMLAGMGIGGLAALGSARLILPRIHALPLKKLSLAAALLTSILVFIVSGGVGLLVLAVATAIGTTGAFAGVKRTHAMAALMLPTLVFYVQLSLFA